MTAAVGIIGGTGALGQGLALRLALTGAEVTIGSRDASRAEAEALALNERNQGPPMRGTDNATVASAHDLLFVCVPFASQLAIAKTIRKELRPGAIVVDATVPLATAIGGRPTQMLGAWRGSAAEQLADALSSRARVVATLHTVAASALAEVDAKLDEDLLVCGDDADAKATVAALLGRIGGLRCVDCGKLEAARMIEPLTALLIGVNGRYRAHAGIRLTGLAAAGWPVAQE
jgi:hypothetical protein